MERHEQRFPLLHLRPGDRLQVLWEETREVLAEVVLDTAYRVNMAVVETHEDARGFKGKCLVVELGEEDTREEQE